MNPQLYFWIAFAVLVGCVIYCNKNYCMLRDMSNANKRPYSWARVQLAWWTIIVLSSFVAIMTRYKVAPGLDESTVILLGISAATIATARTIDVSDETDPKVARHQDNDGSNFVLDILSDQDNVSISRFQTVIFNLVFGVWFIGSVLTDLVTLPAKGVDAIIPIITPANLVLLGLSSATYAAMKATENKSKSVDAGQQAGTAAAATNLEEQPVG
jgi:hypothetical protein